MQLPWHANDSLSKHNLCLLLLCYANAGRMK